MYESFLQIAVNYSKCSLTMSYMLVMFGLIFEILLHLNIVILTLDQLYASLHCSFIHCNLNSYNTKHFLLIISLFYFICK